MAVNSAGPQTRQQRIHKPQAVLRTDQPTGYVIPHNERKPFRMAIIATDNEANSIEVELEGIRFEHFIDRRFMVVETLLRQLRVHLRFNAPGKAFKVLRKYTLRVKRLTP